MRLVFALVLLIGISLAGGAVYLAKGFFQSSQSDLQIAHAKLEKIGPLVEVYVATKTLAYGAPLTKEDVQKVYWPKNSLPENTFADEAVLFPKDQTKPRYVLRQMEKFEPLLAVKITEPGADAGLTTRLGKGMRAFAIKVDVASGVSGFLKPSDRVDVYWTGIAPGSEGDSTRLIESGIGIIAVDQSANDDIGSSATIARTVTVEATPEQVARLAQAQATGRLALSLVGTNDETVASGVEVDSRGLLGIEATQVQAVPEERVCTIKTRKGADVVEMPIPCTN